MSKKPSEFSRWLSDKAPQSPDSLDEKILTYAKAHAKKRREDKPARVGWMPVLTTVSVACIAVLIIYQPSLHTQVDDDLSRSPSLERGLLKDHQPASELALEEVSIAKEQKAVAERPLAAPAIGAADTAKTATSNESMVSGFEVKGSAVSVKQKQRYPKKKTIPVAAMAESALITRLVAVDVNAELVGLQALLQAGKQEQAHADYEALKARCSECNLPERLSDALEAVQP